VRRRRSQKTKNRDVDEHGLGGRPRVPADANDYEVVPDQQPLTIVIPLTVKCNDVTWAATIFGKSVL
jgi:hypothetical protein